MKGKRWGMIKQNLEEEKKTNKNKQCGAPGGREKAWIMVTRNMLRMNEGKKVLSGQKNQICYGSRP